MKYDDYSYLFPPRPEVKVPRDMLGSYIDKGWWCQIKKNGTCTVIFAKDKQVIFKTRHAEHQADGDDHKLWTPKQEHVEFFANVGAPGTWNVYVAELLHSKTPHIKDQLYIFDQIVNNGVQLVGETFAERQARLRERWFHLKNRFEPERDQLRVDKHVSLAKNFKGGFDKLFDALQPEDEGLVLKKPDAPLEACFKHDSNRAWQLKSRILHKNYSF